MFQKNRWRAGALALGLLLMAEVARAQTAALPETLSPQARAAMAAQAKAPQPNGDLASRRAFLDKFQQEFGAKQQKAYAPVEITAGTVAGVPVRWIRAKAERRGERRVLIDLHGGGFNGDSGSLTENIPIAALTGVPVVAVLYRLGPEHLFPAAVDDALAVYRELLKTHRPDEIGVYGTSAGAILGPQLMVRLRAEHLPLPAVLGVFSGDADFSRAGGSALAMKMDTPTLFKPYLGQAPATDPRASPMFADLKGFPPTLCLTSTGDFFLSSTSNFCRALDAAGVETKLTVFEALPHAFWAYLETPESDQAFKLMARDLDARLRKPGG